MVQIAFQNLYFFEKSAANFSAASQPRGPNFGVYAYLTFPDNFAFLHCSLRPL